MERRERPRGPRRRARAGGRPRRRAAPAPRPRRARRERARTPPRPTTRSPSPPHVRGGRAVLAVSDTGIGIAPEDRDRIFERFARGGAERRPGTGLGLPSCRRSPSPRRALHLESRPAGRDLHDDARRPAPGRALGPQPGGTPARATPRWPDPAAVRATRGAMPFRRRSGCADDPVPAGARPIACSSSSPTTLLRARLTDALEDDADAVPGGDAPLHSRVSTPRPMGLVIGGDLPTPTPPLRRALLARGVTAHALPRRYDGVARTSSWPRSPEDRRGG